VETGPALDHSGLAGEDNASARDDRIQILDCIDMLVDDGFIQERPQRFCRLQLRRVGRQKNEPYAFWDLQPGFTMPAGVIENKDNGPAHTRASFACERFQQRLEEPLRHAVGDVPKSLARRGRDEGGHVKPLETVMSRCDWPFANGRPDAPRNRLQTEPVFVAGEDFNWPAGMFGGLFGDGVSEFFLKAAASSAVADFGFLGRGVWMDIPQAFSASQPR